VARLKELRKGLKDLTDSNLIELRNQYQAATEHRETLRTTLVRLRDARTKAKPHFESLLAGFDRRTLQGDSWLRQPVGNALAIMDDVLKQIGDGGAAFEAKLEQAISALESQIGKADEEFRAFSQRYSERVSTLTPEQRGLLESHRKVMEET